MHNREDQPANSTAGKQDPAAESPLQLADQTTAVAVSSCTDDAKSKVSADAAQPLSSGRKARDIGEGEPDSKIFRRLCQLIRQPQ